MKFKNGIAIKFGSSFAENICSLTKKTLAKTTTNLIENMIHFIKLARKLALSFQKIALFKLAILSFENW